MRYYSNGNELIKYIVVLIDFVLLNALMAFFYHFAQAIIPSYFRLNPRIIYLIANIAMAIAQFFIPSVIHHRRISAGRRVRDSPGSSGIPHGRNTRPRISGSPFRLFQRGNPSRA